MTKKCIKKIKIISILLLTILCFSFIQVPQTYALTSDEQYTAGRFAWDLAEMLKNRQPEIAVPAAVYKNDLLSSCLKAATDVYPEGDALIKSIKYSGITRSLSVEYIDTDAKVFIATTKEDLIEARSLSNKLNLSEFLVAFAEPVQITSYSELEAIDPLIEFNADAVTISLYDKTSSTIQNYAWKYPYVYYFNITKGETEADNALTNAFVQEKISKIPTYLSVREKVDEVNKIIVSMFEYEVNYEQNPSSHLPSYMLKTSKGVCSAYAILGYRMLKGLDVPTRIITGHTKSDPDTAHAWLIVKDEGGEWYHFDPTWNDPVPDIRGRVMTDFSYLTDAQMSQTHTWDTANYTKEINDSVWNKLTKFNNPIINLTIDKSEFSINNIQSRVDLNPNIYPIIINDSTYLPLRILVESLGGSISWDGNTQTVTILLDEQQIILRIDSIYASLNGYTRQLIAPPIISEGRTLLPLRSVMELLGKTVDWNGDTRTVTIK